MSAYELKRLTALLIGLIALPTVLQFGGLTYTAAVECLTLAIAGLAINILLGQTGLVSFGHGAWFGIGAYGLGLWQLRVFPDSLFIPLLLTLVILIVVGWLIGLLILRRRGVYFALLTLAFSALCYSVAYRWTSFTGGENGLGGIERLTALGFSLDNGRNFYVLVAIISFLVAAFLLRMSLSPFGRVLNAIRENETRTRFVGFDVQKYKLLAFTLSATITGLAGSISVLNHRIASGEVMSLIFSGELLAIALIGGMRSFSGPIFGALFYILFREYLSTYTNDWLLYFGLTFIVFVLFSPEGLIGTVRRALSYFIPAPVTAAAMSERKAVADETFFPAFLEPKNRGNLECHDVRKTFGGIKAVDHVSMSVANQGVHALIGPNGAGKTSLFNLMSGMFPSDHGTLRLGDQDLTHLSPNEICNAGVARSFQITNLFSGLTVHENLCLSVLARDPRRFSFMRHLGHIEKIQTETTELIRFLGVEGMESAQAQDLSYGGQRVIDMGLALGSAPDILLLDEPLAGLAAAERDRIGKMIRGLGDRIGVLLVEHDVDRVLDMSDIVTVMDQGSILLEGKPDVVRDDPRVREIYIGSGSEALAQNVKHIELPDELTLDVQQLNAFYGKSHILTDVSFNARKGEVIAVLGRNGAGKSTLLKSLVGLTDLGSGQITLHGKTFTQLVPEQMARLGMAFVPQGRQMFSGLSVRDNFMLGRLKRHGAGSNGWSEEEVFSVFPRLKERYDVDATLMSGGEQQMAAIARALVGHVEVLLLDEPFEGLSPAMMEEVFNAILVLKGRYTILIVDHNLELALAAADRALVLDRGRISHIGPAYDLLTDLELRKQKLWL